MDSCLPNYYDSSVTGNEVYFELLSAITMCFLAEGMLEMCSVKLFETCRG